MEEKKEPEIKKENKHIMKNLAKDIAIKSLPMPLSFAVPFYKAFKQTDTYNKFVAILKDRKNYEAKVKEFLDKNDFPTFKQRVKKLKEIT